MDKAGTLRPVLRSSCRMLAWIGRGKAKAVLMLAALLLLYHGTDGAGECVQPSRFVDECPSPCIQSPSDLLARLHPSRGGRQVQLPPQRNCWQMPWQRGLPQRWCVGLITVSNGIYRRIAMVVLSFIALRLIFMLRLNCYRVVVHRTSMQPLIAHGTAQAGWQQVMRGGSSALVPPR